MRNMLGYVVASIAAAVVATLVIGFFGDIDRLLVRALAFPDPVGAWFPELAINGRRFSALVAGSGVLISGPVVLFGAFAFFLLVDAVGLMLFRSADSAWHGETFWERGKPAFAAVIFSVMAATVFLLEEAIGGPFAYLRLDATAVAAAAGIGGLLFGWLEPQATARPWEQPAAPMAGLSALRKAHRVGVR